MKIPSATEVIHHGTLVGFTTDCTYIPTSDVPTSNVPTANLPT